MPKARTRDTAYPDVVILLRSAGSLYALAFHAGLNRAELLWREQAACATESEFSLVLAAALAKHPLRAKTPAALIAPPDVGGLMLVPAGRNGRPRTSFVEQRLTQALPFAADEVLWRSRSASGMLEIFWLPLDWVTKQADALGRLGLTLTEVYPRAALLRAEAQTQGVAALQEADALHYFEQGLVRRSASLPAPGREAEQARKLESLALDDAVEPRRVAPASDPGFAIRLLRLWQDGAEAIHVPTGRWRRWPQWQVWAPLLRAVLASAVLLAVVATGVLWQNDMLESAMEKDAGEQRRLAAAERKYVEMEVSIRRDRKFLAATKALDATPLPLETLNAVAAALPDKYWLQRAVFREQALELSGHGGGNEEVLRVLAKNSIPAIAASSDGVAAKDAFVLRLEPQAR